MNEESEDPKVLEMVLSLPSHDLIKEFSLRCFPHFQNSSVNTNHCKWGFEVQIIGYQLQTQMQDKIIRVFAMMF